jgi:hypothetical protein
MYKHTAQPWDTMNFTNVLLQGAGGQIEPSFTLLHMTQKPPTYIIIQFSSFISVLANSEWLVTGVH